MLGALLGLSAALGACMPQTTEIVTASVPMITATVIRSR